MAQERHPHEFLSLKPSGHKQSLQFSVGTRLTKRDGKVIPLHSSLEICWNAYASGGVSSCDGDDRSRAAGYLGECLEVFEGTT